MTTKRFGDLEVGDVLVGSKGQPVTVVKAYDVHIPESMFEIEFEDGTVIEASGNHLWYIETSFDRSLHRKRLKESHKLLEGLSEQAKSDLLDIATVDELREIELSDMFLVLTGGKDPSAELANAVIRVAESLGHIAEETTTYQDIGSGEEVKGDTVLIYNANLFAQQILALADKRLRKRWGIIIGRVVTTEDLLYCGMDADIPIIKKLG